MPASEGGRIEGAAEVPFSGAEKVPTHLQHTTDEAGQKEFSGIHDQHVAVLHQYRC